MKLRILSALVISFVLAAFIVEHVRAQDTTEYNYVLANWEWDGIWKAPACTDSVIDLRTIPEMTQRKTPSGYGLFAVDSSCSVPPGAINLGTDVNSKLDFPRRVANEFGLPASTLENRSITEFLWLVMVVNADPTGQNNPRPIHPTMDNDVELRFGNKKLKSEKFNPDIHLSIVESHRLGYENIKNRYSKNLALKAAGYWRDKYGFDVRSQPQKSDGILPPETEISEYWNCVDSASLNCTLVWTEISGTWKLESGAAISTSNCVPIEGAPCGMAGANTALSGADMEAETWTNILVTKQRYAGPGVRYDNSTETGYLAAHRDNTTPLRLIKVISGTATQLNNYSIVYTPASAENVGVRADGSSISILHKGNVVDTVTDSSIDGSTVGGLNAGIYHNMDEDERAVFSAFFANDLATPTPTPTATPAPTQVEIVSNGEVFDVDTIIFVAGMFIGLILIGYGEAHKTGQYIMAGALLFVASTVPTGIAWLIVLSALAFIPAMYRGYVHIVVANRQGKVE